MEITEKNMAVLKEAVLNLDKSYSVYSKCKVSCVLVSALTGKRYAGVNVENSSYPCGICAERAALGQAITAEGPEFRINSVFVVNSTGKLFEPCGMCRQALSEFAGPDADVFVANHDLGKVEHHKFSDILPHSFSSDALE